MVIESVAKQLPTIVSHIEQQHDVRVLYACESGSRAWGFASADSDYDVRFIYAHRRDWYLSINLEHERDVIELPVTGSLDVNGWDLRKALKLFYKSNPPLMEWLNSPYVYLDKHAVAAGMRQLLGEYYSPVACRYHYLHMATGNNREYLQGDEVWLKKYFYVLRPLLAVLWLERGLGVVPVEFEKLVEGVVESAELRSAIQALVAAKLEGAELRRGPRIPAISNIIDDELARLQGVDFTGAKTQRSMTSLNTIFLQALQSAWAS